MQRGTPYIERKCAPDSCGSQDVRTPAKAVIAEKSLKQPTATWREIGQSKSEHKTPKYDEGTLNDKLSIIAGIFPEPSPRPKFIIRSDRIRESALKDTIT